MTSCHESPLPRRRKLSICLTIVAISAIFLPLGGCQDGPLYALKAVNPWFVMKEWREDEAFGITDHERRNQLASLAESIEHLPEERQKYWSAHLAQIMANDQSAEMRRLAVLASGKIATAGDAIALVEKGLDDDSMKVRMEACRALGRIDDEESSRMLAAMVGTESNQDVRNAAIASLAQHKNPISVNSLRLALADRNPATRDLTMQSLRGVTGKELGNDPDVWIAELDKTSDEMLNGSSTLMR
ncbi:HEAT repeat protein [Planctomycetes bacterium CA13]|uniref:HEAT repeat protein n=1 Tax=Novipirellula herctigrandis TaxID=2527986 RepID=A0A5C5YNB6_9BACT|nr:HEAT repeat protein [Planctomycetes bacterium CA13]